MKVVDFSAYKKRRTVTLKVNGKDVDVDAKKLFNMYQPKEVREFIRAETESIDSQLTEVLQWGYGFTNGDDDDVA